MTLIDLWNWLKGALGKNPWFTHDKFAHGWINTITARVLLRFGFGTWEAILYSILGWIAYEVIDFIWHCLIKKDADPSTYILDCLRDICWDIGGALIGGLV